MPIARFVEVVNVNRRKSRKPLFHVRIFQISTNENCYREFGFKIKTLKCRSTGTLRWATNSTSAQCTPTNYEILSVWGTFWLSWEGCPDQEFQRWYKPPDLSVESIQNRKSKILKPPHLSAGSI
jgi:hypothetical protein